MYICVRSLRAHQTDFAREMKESEREGYTIETEICTAAGQNRVVVFHLHRPRTSINATEIYESV